MYVLVIMTGWPVWVFSILVSITGTPQIAWHWCFIDRGYGWDPAGLQVEAEFSVPSSLLPYTNVMLFTLICRRSGMCLYYVVRHGGSCLMVLEVLKLIFCKLLLGCRSYCSLFPCQLCTWAWPASCCFVLYFSGRERNVAGLVRGNLNRNFC